MFLVSLVNMLVAAVAVLIHYEFLYRVTQLVPRLNLAYRYRILVGVFAAIIAHAVEVWVFAVAYYWMSRTEGWGQLEGGFEGTLLDCVYFSFTVFTTLGLGDIHPVGDLRYLTGIESLTGLVLITWTASFLYLEMRSHWETR
ncbi:MAG: two pore domain potassium channel family protein [Xanthomonadales bacterium]|nr:two pore domain potassium channel family protein [Xanthomonadales bacterium]